MIKTVLRGRAGKHFIARAGGEIVLPGWETKLCCKDGRRSSVASVGGVTLCCEGGWGNGVARIDDEMFARTDAETLYCEDRQRNTMLRGRARK